MGSDMDAWSALFADDAVHELPHIGSLDLPTQRRGRLAIRECMGRHLGLFGEFQLSRLRTYDAADRETVFAEYALHTTVRATGERYEQSYFAMLKVTAGKIVLLREFPDTLLIARSLAPLTYPTFADTSAA